MLDGPKNVFMFVNMLRFIILCVLNSTSIDQNRFLFCQTRNNDIFLRRAATSTEKSDLFCVRFCLDAKKRFCFCQGSTSIDQKRFFLYGIYLDCKKRFFLMLDETNTR